MSNLSFVSITVKMTVVVALFLCSINLAVAAKCKVPNQDAYKGVEISRDNLKVLKWLSDYEWEIFDLDIAHTHTEGDYFTFKFDDNNKFLKISRVSKSGDSEIPFYILDGDDLSATSTPDDRLNVAFHYQKCEKKKDHDNDASVPTPHSASFSFNSRGRYPTFRFRYDHVNSGGQGDQVDDHDKGTGNSRKGR